MKKKEQFSIALWDRLQKDNIQHTFMTASGRGVSQVTCFDTSLSFPIVGLMNGSNEVSTWMSDGFYANCNKESGNNLMIVWEEEQLMLEGIADIYPNNNVVFHFNNPTPFHSTTIIARVKVSIPYTKGEGLNNPKSN